MNKGLLQYNLKVWLFLLILTAGAIDASAQESQPFDINTSPLPAPTGFVNDYAGVIDAATKQSLEQKLKNLKETNNPPIEFAVAIVNTTGDRPIFDYSMAVARGWGLGSKETDNPSALLFIAINDRKYFTQVSRDLEDELPDGLVGSIQRQYLVPEFKKGNYGKGIEDTIDAYIDAINNRTSGTTVSPTPRQRNTGARRQGIPIQCVCLIIIGILVLFSLLRSKSGGGRGGSSGGGGMGSALPWIIGSAISNSSSGGSSWGSSDSGWSSGGGSDWGGFGGGGDFGGGGAGGDW